MATLREARCQFTVGQARLILWLEQQGYQVASGELERDARVAALNAKAGTGIANSLHLLGLAVDLHLYRDGRYLRDTKDHEPAGRYWESLSPDFAWGGHFGDGNHYSRKWQGRK